jgi:hypothetical protein
MASIVVIRGLLEDAGRPPRSTLASMRKVVAAVLFALTGACLLLSGIVLSNLFDDYKDSPDTLFIGAAAIPLTIAVLCLASGVLALRNGAS